MRRFGTTSRCFMAVISGGGAPRRFTAATKSVVVGLAPAPAEVAAAMGVPEHDLSSTIKASWRHWAAVEIVARHRLTPLASNVGGHLLSDAAKAVAANPPEAPVTNGVETFSKTGFATLFDAAVAFERAMFFARRWVAELRVLELESYHLKDDLKLGLSVFKQPHLDRCKTRLEEVKGLIVAKKAAIAAAGQQNFTTAIVNDLANAARVAAALTSAAAAEDARSFAIRVLDDATAVGVPFDGLTQWLLRHILFGDGPCDDSSLLFTCVEYPERGEISVSDGPLERIADAAVKHISERHHTPVDDGRMLRQSDTHPMLQWSPE